jgi:type I restriction enzyme S subunit
MKFRKVRLCDLCSIVTDYVANGSFKTLANKVKYLNEGYARVIRLVDYNNKYSKKDSIWVSKESYEFLKKSKLYGGEIVLTNVGANLGTVFIAPQLEYPTTLGPNAIMIKTNENDKYLYYWLKSKNGQNTIKSIVTGSAMPKFNKTDLKNIEIAIPCIEDQDKIVEILSNIDKKIELNNQTNDNLYELGDVLYKEYYSKYENELPNGYKYLNLNEVSVNFDSKRKPMSSREREQHKGIYPYYGATSIIDYVDDYIFDDTYLLMGEDGTVKTNEGYPVLQYIWGKSCINNHTHVLQGTIISTEHLMFALRKKNIETLITGAVQPKINQENMNKIKIIIATDDINIKFEEQIKIIVDKIKFNSIENITLTQLRNTLLPKLMNEKIDLNKIEV